MHLTSCHWVTHQITDHKEASTHRFLLDVLGKFTCSKNCMEIEGVTSAWEKILWEISYRAREQVLQLQVYCVFILWWRRKLESRNTIPQGARLVTHWRALKISRHCSVSFWIQRKGLEVSAHNGIYDIDLSWNTLKFIINTVVWVQGTPPCCKWNHVNSWILYPLHYRGCI